MNTRLSMIVSPAIMLVLTILLTGGCGGDENDDNGTVTEVFNGTVFIDLTPGVIGAEGTDSVRFTVRSGTFALEHITRTTDPPMCDSEGEVSGFGTNRARLTPTNWFGINCSEKTPRGEFVAVFRGDSLTMTNVDQTSEIYLFELVLTQRRISGSLSNPVR